VEFVASLSQGRTAAAQCGFFTHKSVPVIFEPPCSLKTCAPSPCECTEISVEATEGGLTASLVTVRMVIDWPARSFRSLVIFTSPSSMFVTIAFTLLVTDIEAFHLAINFDSKTLCFHR